MERRRLRAIRIKIYSRCLQRLSVYCWREILLSNLKEWM